jgi:hypothetical protein
MLNPRRPLAVVALVAALVVAGCASDGTDDVDTVGSTTVAPATSTTAAPAATTTTAASTPVTAAPGQAPTTETDPTAQQAGQRLLDAWTAGDINAAVAVVGSDVANALFSYPTPDTLESLPCRGSETVEAATECDFTYTGGTVTLLITGNAGNGYRVTNVGFVPAP